MLWYQASDICPWPAPSRLPGPASDYLKLVRPPFHRGGRRNCRHFLGVLQPSQGPKVSLASTFLIHHEVDVCRRPLVPIPLLGTKFPGWKGQESVLPSSEWSVDSAFMSQQRLAMDDGRWTLSRWPGRHRAVSQPGRVPLLSLEWSLTGRFWLPDNSCSLQEPALQC